MHTLVLNKLHSQTSFCNAHMGKHDYFLSNNNVELEELGNVLEVECISYLSVSFEK